MPVQISPGPSITLVNALAVGAGVNSASFALPAQACMLSWQITYGTPPASNTINLQASNDGSNWSTIDSTTGITQGNIRFTFSAARFLRVNMSAVAGGDTFTITLVADALAMRTILTGNGFVVAQSAQVGNGAVATEEVLFSLIIPARVLVTNGRSIRFRWAGKSAANGNVKTGRIRFGGDNFVLFNSAINNVDFTGELIVMRRSFGIQIRRGITNLNAIAPGVVTLAIAVDETAPITVQITGQSAASAANDVTLEMVIVDTCPDLPGLP